MANKILKRQEVEDVTKLSRSTIYSQMSEGSFPKSIALGPRSVGWLESDIQAWIEQRIADSKAA